MAATLKVLRSVSRACDDFRAAMAAVGIQCTGEINCDGRLHRFKAGDDRTRNSWYVLHPEPPFAGAFGCWKRGIKETWCERNGSLSQAEWQHVRECWQAAKRERERVETDRQAKAQKTAAWILKRSRRVLTHGYLAAKNVRVFGEVRESYRGELVLPLRDENGELHSLQFSAAGEVSPELQGTTMGKNSDGHLQYGKTKMAALNSTGAKIT